MHRDGHIGVALAAYAPIGAAAALQWSSELAYLGAGLAAALSTLPDADTKVPLLAHRGWTHTVWFALIVGAACRIAGSWAGHHAGLADPATLGTLWGLVGIATILSHIAADAITPMGVRPFAPFGDRFSLRLVPSASRPANLTFLVVGSSALVVALSVATRTG